MRFSTRFHSRRISRASQSVAMRFEQAHRGQHRRRIALGSEHQQRRAPARWCADAGWRRRARAPWRSGQKPRLCAAFGEIAGSASPARQGDGRAGCRAVERDRHVRYDRVGVRRVRAGSARCPAASPAGRMRRGELLRPLGDRASQADGGTTSSTSRHSTARLPLTPSSVVQKTSARSRRTLRLSVTRVRPPVPGSTREQRQFRQRDRGAPSSTSMMWSQASASS